MIIKLHPPRSAGPLELGATGDEVIATMRQFGDPEVLCRAVGDRAGWCVMHPSGLFLSAYFDADDRAEAIELGRPTDPGVTVTYGGLDIFRTPAADLVEALRRTTRVVEEENEYSYTAPELLLALWRSTTPEDPDDAEGNYFESVLVAGPRILQPGTADDRLTYVLVNSLPTAAQSMPAATTEFSPLDAPYCHQNVAIGLTGLPEVPANRTGATANWKSH